MNMIQQARDGQVKREVENISLRHEAANAPKSRVPDVKKPLLWQKPNTFRMLKFACQSAPIMCSK